MKTTATGKILYSEHEIQSSFFQWVDLMKAKHPVLNYFFAVPNGANKSPAARAKFKREGLRAGVPDVFCPVPSACGQYAGLAFEFKAQGGRTSFEQDVWIEALKTVNYRVEIVKDWQAAADVAIEYHGLDMEKFRAD